MSEDITEKPKSDIQPRFSEDALLRMSEFIPGGDLEKIMGAVAEVAELSLPVMDYVPKPDSLTPFLDLKGTVLSSSPTTTFSKILLTAQAMLLFDESGVLTKSVPVGFGKTGIRSSNAVDSGFLGSLVSSFVTQGSKKESGENMLTIFDEIVDCQDYPNMGLFFILKNGEVMLLSGIKSKKFEMMKVVLPKEARESESLHFSGKYLICKTAKGETKVYDVEKSFSEVEGNWGCPDDIRLAEILPDGKKMIWALVDGKNPLERGLVVWDSAKGKEILRNNDVYFEYDNLIVTPDGKYVLAPYTIRVNHEQNIAVFDALTLKLLTRKLFFNEDWYSPKPLPSSIGKVSIFEDKKDGHNKLFFDGDYGHFWICDLSSGEAIVRASPHQWVVINDNKRISGPFKGNHRVNFYAFLSGGDILSLGEESVHESVSASGLGKNGGNATFERDTVIKTIRVTPIEDLPPVHLMREDSTSLKWRMV